MHTSIYATYTLNLKNPHRIHVLLTVSLACPFFHPDSVLVALELLLGSGNANRRQVSVAGHHSFVSINEYMQTVS